MNGADKAGRNILRPLLVLALLGSGSAPAHAAVEWSLLLGRVTARGSSAALRGAHVEVSGQSAVTDEDGRFQLALAPGDAEVLVTADGYRPWRVVEHLVASRGLLVDYRLEPRPIARPLVSEIFAARRHQGERITIEGEELRTTPGTLGDPARVLVALPGVAAALPQLPYFGVRGASPGTNGYFLDGMAVPQLLHALFGGVVHPGLVDRLDFYAGGYDVTFGRTLGGVIDLETRPARADGWHGEVELRPWEASALVEAPLGGDVRLAAAGHYGSPSYLLHLADPTADVGYWDYLLRVDRRGLTVEALGSGDDVAIDGMATHLTFHRLQVRQQQRLGRAAIEAALVGSYDETHSAEGVGVRKLGVVGRAQLRGAWHGFQLLAGIDGEVSQFTALGFNSQSSSSGRDALGELGTPRTGVVAGGYVEGTAQLLDRLDATAGVRADLYHAGSVTLLGIDPRISARLRLAPWLSTSASFGVYHQPPTFLVPLPGLDTFALALGLQTSWQGSVTVAARLPPSLLFSLTGYYARLHNVTDATLGQQILVCAPPPPRQLTGLPATLLGVVDGDAYGMEVLLRRREGRVTGWLAYTLSRSERLYPCGLRPSDTDQTHMLNLVVQARLPWRLVAGLRLAYATGRPTTLIRLDDPLATLRGNARLPDFFQMDLRLDREWLFERWSFAVFLEAVNLTYSRTVFWVHYPLDMHGDRQWTMPTQVGFSWVLPSLGLRGRF